jgi:hypothetical protein
MAGEHITAEGWAIIAASFVATVSTIGAALRWAIYPRLREVVRSTITESVGPQIAEVPNLTEAVNRLTEALGQQSKDTTKLDTTITGLAGEIKKISEDMTDLKQRTANLEGAFPSVAATAEAAAKVVESAARAAEAAGKAAADAAASVLKTALITAEAKAHFPPKHKTAKKKR